MELKINGVKIKSNNHRRGILSNAVSRPHFNWMAPCPMKLTVIFSIVFYLLKEVVFEINVAKINSERRERERALETAKQDILDETKEYANAYKGKLLT